MDEDNAYSIITLKADENTKRVVKYYTPVEEHDTLSDDDEHDLRCHVCSSKLDTPYIECAECLHFICVNCFARGGETSVHKNNHSYSVQRDVLSVFDSSDWSGKEELQLLDALYSQGIDNWDGVSKKMVNRSPEECRIHYYTFYFGGMFERELGLESDPYIPRRVPFMYRMRAIDPPRPDLDSVTFKTMAGYRCARGDFDTPYDNSAESIVSNLDTVCGNFSKADDDLLNEMKVAVFRAYNHRVSERHRRYKIMKEHGLIMSSRTLGWFSEHIDALGSSHTNKFGGSGRFIAFMQLLSGLEFDSTIESIQHGHDLNKYLQRLYEWRRLGITSFHGAKLYNKLKAKRLNFMREKRIIKFMSMLDWRNSQSGTAMRMSNSYITIRRKSTPLDILGLPGYSKLSEDEKALCSVTRLVPYDYLEYKAILVNENSKGGYLRLADARKLIKIDVNKTRKLYDFLVKAGYVNKEI